MGARLTKSLEIFSSVELCEGRAYYAEGVRAFCITSRGFARLRKFITKLSKYKTKFEKTEFFPKKDQA